MKHIEIKGLFNRFNYSFDFGGQEIQMLTGPNGFGKSTILRCIKAFSDSDLRYFFTLPFKSIRIGNSEIKEEVLIEKNAQKQLLINGKYITEKIMLEYKSPYPRNGVDGRIDYMAKIWDESEQNTSDLGQLGKSDYKKILITMKDLVGDVFFIEEQRLIQRKQNEKNSFYFDAKGVLRTEKNSGDWESIIELIPGKIKGYLDTVAGEYANKANSLDATYPQRLFDDSDDSFSEEEYKRQRELMNEKLDKLKKYEISQFRKMEAQYKAKYEKALKIYFEDFNEKYKTYEQLIEKLDMFTDMVNKRIYFDEIRIDKDKGCVVVDKENEKDVLDLNKLSSGEKEIIVLFYKLIFEVKEGTMLLLDEPEISLHVAWQRMFAEDMYTIAKKRGIRILAATHAPMIINGHRDVQIDLGELYGRACKRLNQA